jgi:hypothetical protein
VQVVVSKLEGVVLSCDVVVPRTHKQTRHVDAAAGRGRRGVVRIAIGGLPCSKHAS